MSVQQREVLEEGLAAFREVFDTNKVAVTREQMRRLLNLEIMIDQLISGLKAIEGVSREDLVKLVTEVTPPPVESESLGV